jgi:hypothetical protein
LPIDRGAKTAFPCAQAFNRYGIDLASMHDWLGHANTEDTITYTVLTAREESARKVFSRLRSN